jgi:TPR repeat protein
MTRLLAGTVLAAVSAALASANCKPGLDAYSHKDYAAALAQFKAIEKEPCAEYALGVMSEKGNGVPQDYKEAIRWYRMAADQGYALAQFNLGVLYANGFGTAQDFKEALKWYTMAADQGLAIAEYNIGVLHAQGRGVPSSSAEAAKWWLRSAEHGDADAQYSLGYLYEFGGEGFAADPSQAYFWYSVLLSRFPNAAVAMKGRDNVVKKLQPAQVSALDAQVKNWKPAAPAKEPQK